MFERASQLVDARLISEADAEELLTSAGFSDWRAARDRLQEMCPDDDSRGALAECLPMLLVALSDAATADGSLINFERFVQSVPERAALFRYLATNPRAVEILIKLFVGSQFLTEILLRNPSYLEQLTNHKRLAEFKSRQQFVEEALEAAVTFPQLAAKFDALRRFQRWELLRIGACDSFGLMDLKSVTVQLSLLADSLVQCCLALLSQEMRIDPAGFAVLAFGKLGGKELNYSSDIDLVFLSDEEPTRFWPLGQRLIKALTEATGEGFLYRVDMRLRPWGRSGSLVNSVEAHLNYLKQHGKLWEKQALIKARTIAGDAEIGAKFLARAEPLIYNVPVEAVRKNIREMKGRIEAELERQGRKWGEVKSGEGSIRDIEFVTQFLQLAHGGAHPEVRSISTLDGLVRLADFGFLQADEYRQLTIGYGFLRTIEHALQLMHHKQTHSIPIDEREIAWFARRLDFQDAGHLLRHYQQHCEAIRAIYLRYIGGEGESPPPANGDAPDQYAEHLARMGPSYSETFSEEEIARHAAMIRKLSDENIVEIDARPRASGKWTMTVVGYDHTGDLSMMCGLLFVYGFDIAGGNVFTAEHVSPRHSAGGEERGLAKYFVNVFVVKPPLEVVLPEIWTRYKKDLAALLRLVEEGFQREAQGMLAKRVAGALREVVEPATSLYPVDIDIDNEASDTATVLHIRSEDTIGFLYELTNALAMAGIDVGRVIISSVGTRVFDTLYVTDTRGAKLIDPERQRELRAAVVLIKHFTHLLPRSPNPQAALLHFRDFLEQLFRQPNWLEELSTLERSEVLTALARLLGVSDFLWDDFLRLQYANLFPVVKDVDSLATRKSRAELECELQAELAAVTESDLATAQAERRARLNAFKDREMFRTDMRHILGRIPQFGQFSEELTDVAEVVVAAALGLVEEEFQARYGRPQLETGNASRLCVAALGKCRGRELGFASDIELMFVYEGAGSTTGPEVVANSEYFEKLVEAFMQVIEARREGIFQVDLRLRPYGRAGSLAVGLDAFERYFAADGPAWPFERQALVKLRPVAGDAPFGRRLEALRDALIYTESPFDAAAMRAMREKQVRQLVQAGTFNAKLSPGGLVDFEYLVQGLQITHGNAVPSLRTTNTLDAMSALVEAGILMKYEHAALEEAYVFLRRLIDALRMVRGHARDLTVPPHDREEFDFLARRLGYGSDTSRLQRDLQRFTSCVQEFMRLLEGPPRKGSPA